MTGSTETGRRSARLARVLGPLLAVGAVVLAGAVARGGAADGPYLDPASTGRAGTRAVVDVLDDLGIDVTVPGPRAAVAALRDADVVLVLGDGDGLRPALEEVLGRGGRVVVAGLGAPFTEDLTPAAPGPTDGLGRTGRAPACDLLPDVGQVRVAVWAGWVVPVDGEGCFGLGGPDAWLVAVPRGGGEVVALGGPEPLQNAELGQGDNAVLVASLLAPRTPGGTTVVLGPEVVGLADDATIADLVPRRAVDLLVAASLLAVVAALWRGRRHGPVVEESLPVRVPGGELVRALADLQQRAGLVGPAATTLRADARRQLAAVVGLPSDADPRALAAAVAAVTGTPASTVRATLAGPEPTAGADLVVLARDLADLVATVIHADAPVAHVTTDPTRPPSPQDRSPS
ncbi:MAG: DUF4350 domain-containing protein [Actinomycetes bacterium]